MSGVDYLAWIISCLLCFCLLVYGLVRLVRWMRRPKDHPVREIRNVRKGRYL